MAPSPSLVGTWHLGGFFYVKPNNHGGCKRAKLRAKLRATWHVVQKVRAKKQDLARNLARNLYYITI